MDRIIKTKIDKIGSDQTFFFFIIKRQKILIQFNSGKKKNGPWLIS